jgi:hypothetical protein
MSETEEDDGKPPTLSIQLAPPIVFKGGNYTSIELREPKAGEVRKAEGQMRNGIHSESLRLYNMHLISMVSGLSIPVLELVPIGQFNEAAEYLAGFIESGRGTGRT